MVKRDLPNFINNIESNVSLVHPATALKVVGRGAYTACKPPPSHIKHAKDWKTSKKSLAARLPEHHVIAVVGRSGSGRSTSISKLSGQSIMDVCYSLNFHKCSGLIGTLNNGSRSPLLRHGEIRKTALWDWQQIRDTLLTHPVSMAVSEVYGLWPK